MPFCLGKYIMPTTKYYRPKTLVNRTILNTTTNQNSIDWNYNGSISENNYAVTQLPLHTISGLWMERFLSNTSQLWCVNLGIPNPSVSGSEQVGSSYTFATDINGHTDNSWLAYPPNTPPGRFVLSMNVQQLNDLLPGWVESNPFPFQIPLTVTDARGTVINFTAGQYSVGAISFGYPRGLYAEVDWTYAGDAILYYPLTISTTNYVPAVTAITKTVTGIEFNLVMERYARIEDLLVQLTLGGNLIGDNRASTINPVPADIYTGDDYGVIMDPPGNNYTYGSSSDLWGTALTSADIADPTFGIVVSFRSNPAFPHRDLAYLYQLGIRITYA